MAKKKVDLAILLLLCLLFLLIGGLFMHKITVKQEVFTLQEIDTISLDGNTADVTIIQSKSNEFKISQFSMKSIEKSMEYQTELSNGDLHIKDNSAQVNWFMGIKGSAGISYEIQVPVDKTVKFKINMNKGNLNITNGIFKSLDIAIDKSGNINLTNVNLEGTSEIYTYAGNIDVKFNSDSSNIMVNAIAMSGNKTIDNKYHQGKYLLNIKSGKGNITVK